MVITGLTRNQFVEQSARGFESLRLRFLSSNFKELMHHIKEASSNDEAFLWYKKLPLHELVPKRIAKQFFQMQNLHFALFPRLFY